MIRKIIEIDQDKCNGCGICADACHEGAIAMVDGKAKLIRDDYCDGLGDCLPTCPTGAISFVQREAAQYNKEAAEKNKAQKLASLNSKMPNGCMGSKIIKFDRQEGEPRVETGQDLSSQLMQWPCQIKLVPVNAPYFDKAKLLVAADCTAFAYSNFHQDFMKGKVTLIGCPKLDEVDYSEKLTQILATNDIQSLTILRMEVPCCGGLENAAKMALQKSGKFIPWQVVTITVDGKIKERL